MAPTLQRSAPKDSSQLTELATRSESVWNLPGEFIAQFRTVYSVSAEFIETNLVYSLLQGHELIGFFGIIPKPKISLLEYFYLEPKFIGKGYGKSLWQNMLSVCADNNIQTIEFVCGPEPLAFYLHQGASIVGTETSKLSETRSIFRLNHTVPLPTGPA